MKEYFVLKRPIVTERSSGLKEKLNQYVFEVSFSASKNDIKEAIHKLFKVQVEKVRTAIFHGKMKRLSMGKPQGQRSDWKKAIVTVKKGQEIKFDQEIKG